MPIDFIKPSELPVASSVNTSAAIVVENGATVEKATPAQVVDAGRPIATEAQALAGLNNTTAMTPLTTKQALDNYPFLPLAGGTMSGPLAFSRAAQAMLTFNNTGNANANVTTIRETNAGDFGIVHGSDNTLAFLVEPAGTTITEDEAAVTKEKGDARYLLQSTAASTYLPITTAASTYAPLSAFPRVFYASEALLAAAVSGLTNGTICDVCGRFYQVDTSVLLEDSALRAYGVAGIKVHEAPLNFYFGSFFQRDPADVFFVAGVDGLHFSPLNDHPFPMTEDGANIEKLNGGAPYIFPYKGRYYVFTTGGVPDQRDFKLQHSDDLVGWISSDENFGPTTICSDTTPISGGTQPCDRLWVPTPVIDVDGTLYLIMSVRYGDNLTDDYGNPLRNFRQMYATLSIASDGTLTVGTPVSLDMNTDLSIVSYIGGEFMVEGGELWLAVKNDVNKNIEVWKSDGGMTGEFTLQEELTNDISMEGYSWVKTYTYEDNGSLTKKYRLYIDQNRQGPNESYPDEMAEIQWFFEADVPQGPWTGPTRFYTGKPTRHGTLHNISRGFDAKVFTDIERLRISHGRDTRQNFWNMDELADGPQFRSPQDNFCYYIQGTDKHAEVTFGVGAADRFWVGVFSSNKGTGVTVVDDSDDNIAGGPHFLGFGAAASKLYEFRRREDERFYLMNPDAPPPVVMNMASAQTVTGGTATVVEYDTVVDDALGTFDTSTHRWTPVKGRIQITAQVLIPGGESEADVGNTLRIRKNGTVVRYVVSPGHATIQEVLDVCYVDFANGTDYYDVTIELGGTADSRSVSASTIGTSFTGIYI